MARQTDLPCDPLGLSLHDAASYLSLSPNMFLKQVASGVMPKPKRLGTRRVWDREEVRAAFKNLPTDGEPEASDKTWEDVDAA